MAAEAWVREHTAPSERLLVDGIRSIGTSLSAVVAQKLGQSGCEVQRITVRPGGHPFQRQLDIAPEQLRVIGQALIVDGHPNEPGAEASEQSRRWWQQTRRYFTPLEQVRWQERALL